MISRRFGVLLSIFFIPALSSAALAFRAAELPASKALSPAEYGAELVRIESVLGEKQPDLDALLASIPPEWTVAGGQQSFKLSNEWLISRISFVNKYTEKEARTKSLEELRVRVREAISQAQAYISGNSVPDAKGKLAAILRQKQFKSVKGLTLEESLYEKLLQWTIRVLRLIMRNPQTAAKIANVIVYSFISLILIAVAYGLWRWLIRREMDLGPREIISFTPSDKSWQTWLAEARAAAAGGQLRDAVHLAYWSAISRLEMEGAWRRDRARTPREYLRLLNSHHQHWSPLKDLTGCFELIWYGNRPANTDDFDRVCGYLARMGCR